MTEATFAISGMSCGTRAKSVERVLLALEGVHAADANHVLDRAVGALCHQGSSLFVILNSMRLLLATPRGRRPCGASAG